MEKERMLILKEIAGTPGRIRTCDLLLRRQPLYPSELQAHAIKAADLPGFDLPSPGELRARKSWSSGSSNDP